MNSSAPDRIYFNTEALPERDRFPAVREEFARQLLAVDCTKRGASPFSAKFDVRRVGRFALGYIETSPADYVRTRVLFATGRSFCSRP